MVEKETLRTSLKVEKVGNRQDIPGKTYQKLEFNAYSEKAKSSFLFMTFRRDLMEIIEKSVGKTIDVEAIADEKKITDIFINGKSVKEPKDDGKASSIEAQVAVKAIVDLRIAGIEIPEDILNDTFDWLRKALKGGL